MPDALILPPALVAVLAAAGAALAAGLGIAALRRSLPATTLTSGREARDRAPRRLGGLAVGPLAILGALYLSPALALGLALLWIVGTWDDARDLPIWPRLLAHAAAAVLALHAIAPSLPWEAQAFALVFLVGSVNAANFTDGADLSAVAFSGVPLAGSGLLAAWAGAPGAAVALLAGGAMLGHAWHNRAPARVFLGDGGALPLGLAVGASVLLLWPLAGPFALAPFMALYADTGLTLLHGVLTRKRVWEPHHRHAYHRALDRGVPRGRVLGAVLALDAAGLLTLGLALN